MHQKCKCDNPEGNLCNACEAEVKEVKATSITDNAKKVAAKTADLWWPEVVAKRSINSGTGAALPGFMYV